MVAAAAARELAGIAARHHPHIGGIGALAAQHDFQTVDRPWPRHFGADAHVSGFGPRQPELLLARQQQTVTRERGDRDRATDIADRALDAAEMRTGGEAALQHWTPAAAVAEGINRQPQP